MRAAMQAARCGANKRSALRRWSFILCATLTLAACASQPPSRTVERVSLPPPSRTTTKVYFYPTAGQNAEQQDRDRFECCHWAVKQTGVAPNQSHATRHEWVETIPAPPSGEHTAAGAVTGALIGAISDAARQESATQSQAGYEHRQAVQSAAHNEQSSRDFRRAMSACLEGRGYSVR